MARELEWSSAQFLQEINGEIFMVPSRYSMLRLLGSGTFGIVACAYDEQDHRYVAIKKISDPFDFRVDREYKRRILREVLSLIYLRGSKNVVTLEALPIPCSVDHFKDLYIVTDLVDRDLKNLLSSNHICMSALDIKLILRGIIRGLRDTHATGIIHRDIKPANILVSNDLRSVKLCDYGLSCTDRENHVSSITSIATLWYKAPELLLSWPDYDKAVDMWAVGCIFAELLARKKSPTAFFMGKDAKHQLNLIINVIGTPRDDQVHGCEKSKQYLKTLPYRPKSDLASLLPPDTETSAIDLLERLLCFDPTKRITAEQALKHPYFYSLDDDNDMPITRAAYELYKTVDMDEISSSDIRELVFNQCIKFNESVKLDQRQEVRTMDPYWEKRLCTRMDFTSLDERRKADSYRNMILDMAEQACTVMERMCCHYEVNELKIVMSQFRRALNEDNFEIITTKQREFERYLRTFLYKYRLDID
jgi:serine/threonine protein kinase